jgi:hypothetical protein
LSVAPSKKTAIFEVLLSSKTTVYNIMFGVELNQSNLRTVAHNLLFPRNTGNQLPVPPAKKAGLFYTADIIKLSIIAPCLDTLQ